jgi:ABC-type sulfate transport system permease component
MFPYFCACQAYVVIAWVVTILCAGTTVLGGLQATRTATSAPRVCHAIWSSIYTSHFFSLHSAPATLFKRLHSLTIP